MGDLGNSLRHLGLIATSPSWRKWWVQIMIARWKKSTAAIAPESTQRARDRLPPSGEA